RAGSGAALAGGDAEPRGRGVEGEGRGSGARHDRAVGAAAGQLFPFFRRARRIFDAAWSQRGGPNRLRSRDCARQYVGGSRPYPQASRPPDARQRAEGNEGGEVTPLLSSPTRERITLRKRRRIPPAADNRIVPPAAKNFHTSLSKPACP